MRLIILLIFLTTWSSWTVGQPPQVRQEQHLSKDIRQQPAKTLNGHFPFQVPSDVGSWHLRAEKLRRRILVATGLWPMPTKTPLNAVVHGKTEREGFSIEKVYFESLPGHFVTGLLFRPSGETQAKRPGILCPHGHGGRMQSHSDNELASQIAQGAEHFTDSGRTPKIARCVQLAKMGCVTFIFDMLGYEDSVQIPYEVAHRHQNPRPEEQNDIDSSWIFFSADADLRCQSIMGLQTWNAIRALDFLESLPDVDANRLAVTGGSGGGTQSILLGAIDTRVKVSFPNGMVSTSMQGGCYCENCNLLRIDTGNVELAALFAPRPQAMTAADDWTRDMMKDGYPELQWLYAMIGNTEDVYCRPMLHFKHNYNYVTRATMYQWMNRHLELGLDIPVIEQDFKGLTEDESAVWNEEHPSPKETGVAHERSVCHWWDEQSKSILKQAYPRDPSSFEDFKKWYGQAWDIIFDQGLPSATQWTDLGSVVIEDAKISRVLLRCPERETELPLLVATRDKKSTPTGYLIWTQEFGKGDAFEDSGSPSPELMDFLDRGLTVVLPDLMHQGEWSTKEAQEQGPRLVDDKRAYSAFTYGYNRSLAAERCSDLLTVVAAVSQLSDPHHSGMPILLLGDQGTSSWSVPAATIAGSIIDHAILKTEGSRYGDVRHFKDKNFVPGAVKYGDIPSLIALRSPHRTTVVGEQKPLPLVIDAFRIMKSPSSVKFVNDLNPETLLW